MKGSKREEKEEGGRGAETAGKSCLLAGPAVPGAGRSGGRRCCPAPRREAVEWCGEARGFVVLPPSFSPSFLFLFLLPRCMRAAWCWERSATLAAALGATGARYPRPGQHGAPCPGCRGAAARLASLPGECVLRGGLAPLRPRSRGSWGDRLSCGQTLGNFGSAVGVRQVYFCWASLRSITSKSAIA